jgi:CHAT domain-containing protein
MRQNLGWLAGLAGHVPLAFAHYDAAEAAFRQAGAITGLLRLDRGSLLARAGLLADARRELALAVDELAAGGMEADLAEARVAFAEVALMTSERAAARTAARLAERAFAVQGRARWRLLARLVLLRADADETGAVALERRASRLAGELQAAGWASAAVDARLIAARSALARGRNGAAREHLRRAGRPARGAPLAVQAAAWHAEALLRLRHGDRRGAGRAVAAGLRAVEAHRAGLGATELRVHATRHGVPLATLGIDLALRTGRGARVLQAAERARAATLRQPPLRPPAEVRLAAALADLRRVVAQVEEAILEERDARRLVAQQVALEREIRARTRHTAAGAAAAPPRLDELATALGDRRFLELVEHEGLLHVVEMGGGRTRLRVAGPAREVEADQRFLAFALRRSAARAGSREARSQLDTEARRAAERLQDRLLGPEARDERELVIVPTGALHALAWSALPACRGRPVSVAPSAALWLRAARQRPAEPPERCALVAGPGLPHATAEVSALAAAYPGDPPLLGHAATVDATLALIAAAPQAHIAAHGTFRVDSPMFSSLRLRDGALTVLDLESLHAPPRLIVLTACDAGRSDVSPGDELRGVVAALLALGTCTVIASTLPVPDAGAAEFAVALHANLRRGRAPAAALADAVASVPVAGAGFACFGAG